MPRFDRTGPRGLGPMTGRARGFCAMPVGGIAYRRGYTHLWDYPAYRTPYGQQEIEQLRNDLSQVLNELEDLETRIAKLEKH